MILQGTKKQGITMQRIRFSNETPFSQIKMNLDQSMIEWNSKRLLNLIQTKNIHKKNEFQLMLIYDDTICGRSRWLSLRHTHTLTHENAKRINCLNFRASFREFI